MPARLSDFSRRARFWTRGRDPASFRRSLHRQRGPHLGGEPTRPRTGRHGADHAPEPEIVGRRIALGKSGICAGIRRLITAQISVARGQP
jgi:hypothetical protein